MSFSPQSASSAGDGGRKVRRTAVTRVSEAVKALALCHNVTPVYETVEGGSDAEQSDTEADQQINQKVVYQASSPDEVSRSLMTTTEPHA